MPYKAENWHALSHQQYFLRHGFVDICRCALNITQTSLVDTKDESDRHPENIRQKFTKSSKLGIPMENLKTSFFEYQRSYQNYCLGMYGQMFDFRVKFPNFLRPYVLRRSASFDATRTLTFC